MWRKREPKHLFPLGQIITTADAWQVLQKNGKCASDLVERHVVGDWGVVGPVDRETNDYAVKVGHTIESAYAVGEETLYVRTAHDRSRTAVCVEKERYQF